MSEAWGDAARDSLRAAKLLHSAGHSRSCVSRCYYAAYAAVTGALTEVHGDVGPAGRANPSHAQPDKMIRHNLDPRRFRQSARQRIARSVRTLYRLRITSDYDAGARVSDHDFRLSLREVSSVLLTIEETNG